MCAILGWEPAHVGDPVEDLGWFCVRARRFGNDVQEACGNFKLALVFIRQARVFLDGVASVELASLGRRIAEAEQGPLNRMQEAV